MTTQATPTLEVAKIDVDERLDVRTRQGTDGLRRLPASMAGSPEAKGEVAR
jgi:hypothetical protein